MDEQHNTGCKMNWYKWAQSQQDQQVSRYLNIFKSDPLVESNKDRASLLIKEALKYAQGHEEALYLVREYLKGTYKPNEDEATVKMVLKNWRSLKTRGEVKGKLSDFQSHEEAMSFIKEKMGVDTSQLQGAGAKQTRAIGDLKRYYIGTIDTKNHGKLMVYHFNKDNMSNEEEEDKVRTTIGKLCFGSDYTWCILPDDNGPAHFKHYSRGTGFFLYIDGSGRAVLSHGFGDRGIVDPVNGVIEDEELMQKTHGLLYGGYQEGYHYFYMDKGAPNVDKEMKMYKAFGNQHGMAHFLDPKKEISWQLLHRIQNDIDRQLDSLDEDSREYNIYRKAQDNASYKESIMTLMDKLNADPIKRSKFIESKMNNEDINNIEKEIMEIYLRNNKDNIEAKVSNLAQKGDVPNFAFDWASKILESGQAPKEWIEAIGRRIEQGDDVPNFAFDWARNILNSEKEPKEWIEAIGRKVEQGGDVPNFAIGWASKILESGQAPKEWVEAIGRRIEQRGDVPNFAKDWVREPGKLPKKLIEAIGKRIEQTGDSPDFAKDWVREIMYSGEIPEALTAGISRSIEQGGDPPNFAFDWARNILNSGKAPKEWIEAIGRRIEQRGNVPNFAFDWARNKLESRKAPEEWTEGISRSIAKTGDVSEFGKNWANEIWNSGKAPKEWIEGISKRIEQGGDPPNFAEYWAEIKMDSGNAPKEWIEGISRRIEQTGNPPWFARGWARNILESGKAPKEWIEGIGKSIANAETKHLPKFAEDWILKTVSSENIPEALTTGISSYVAKTGEAPRRTDAWAGNILNSGKAPKEWIEAIDRRISQGDNVSDFAIGWARNILESGKAPKKWIKSINNSIIQKGDAPNFSETWASKILESGKAPKEWIEGINNSIAKTGTVPYFAKKWVEKIFSSGQAPKEWIAALYSQGARNRLRNRFLSNR
jgi:hypothetical protein